MNRPRVWAGCFGLLCALAIPPTGVAFAAGPAKPALGESLSGPAKDAYVSAQILLNNSDFGGALKKYSQAYDLSKDPRLLFNMAVCARSLRAYARMQSFLTRYVRESGTAMTPEDKADVDNALAAIRNLVGTVRVAVTEAGADIALDGTAAGTTPLAEPLVVELGPHKLSVTKAGFDPAEQAIDVQGGAEVAAAITLVAVRHVAQLIVSSDDDATVSVDDKVPAKGRFDGQVASGTHDVRVTEPGKVEYRAQVDLKDGETRTLQVTLEGEKHGALWPWVAGGAAVLAGAVVGGYFLFKSSPAAPAPLSGGFATVQLSAFGGH
jgi:hypothetical protein